MVKFVDIHLKNRRGIFTNFGNILFCFKLCPIIRKKKKMGTSPSEELHGNFPENIP